MMEDEELRVAERAIADAREALAEALEARDRYAEAIVRLDRARRRLYWSMALLGVAVIINLTSTLSSLRLLG